MLKSNSMKVNNLYQRLLEYSFDAIAIHKDNKIAYLNEMSGKNSGRCLHRRISLARSIFDFIHPVLAGIWKIA